MKSAGRKKRTERCPCCGHLPPRWRMTDRRASLEIDRLRAEVEALRERVRALEELLGDRRD